MWDKNFVKTLGGTMKPLEWGMGKSRLEGSLTQIEREKYRQNQGFRFYRTSNTKAYYRGGAETRRNI
jgi:hypothetical protein